MGTNNRKKSGKIFTGSRLIVDGQGNSGVLRNKSNGFNNILKTVNEGPGPDLTPTPTNTPTNTPTPSVTTTITPTPTLTPTNTQTQTNTPTPTPSITPTNTITPTLSITPTNTITPSITSTLTPTPSITPTTPECRCWYLTNPTAGSLNYTTVNCSGIISIGGILLSGESKQECAQSVSEDLAIIKVNYGPCTGGCNNDTFYGFFGNTVPFFNTGYCNSYSAITFTNNPPDSQGRFSGGTAFLDVNFDLRNNTRNTIPPYFYQVVEGVVSNSASACTRNSGTCVTNQYRIEAVVGNATVNISTPFADAPSSFELPKNYVVYMCLCSEPTGTNLSVTNLGSCPYNIG